MKKVITIGLIVMLLCGCTSKKEQTEQLTKLANKYYTTYASNLDIDEYTVTIADLKKANKELKQKYDLKIVEDCKDSSKVTLTIKDKKVVKTKINLNC